jgi:hypothetical protein
MDASFFPPSRALVGLLPWVDVVSADHGGQVPRIQVAVDAKAKSNLGAIS